MFKNLLYILILFAGFPSAIYLSKICYDEIAKWRLRFFLITITCLIIVIILSFTDFYYKTPAVIGLFYIMIMNLTIIWRIYK